VPVDFVKNAESLGALAFPANDEAALRDALKQAKAADRTTVIHVPVQIDARVPGFESWWDVPIAEVSEELGVQKARSDYLRSRVKQRAFV
jgi:3D-(3,5/4)-trihydroxycyclohexane-1,2-dione acylhydrolase (decyclizing)